MTNSLRVVALEYHDIIGTHNPDDSGFPGPAAASYKISTALFRAHMSTLAALASRVKLPNDIACQPSVGDSVMLTFDDGGASAITHTAPILEEHGLRGVFFITTDRIDTVAFLTAAQIRDLARRGHTIGSHSCSHPARLSACTPDTIAREWRDSVHRLEAIVRAEVTSASVPGGYYSRTVASAAAAAGIQSLFTSEPTTRVAWVDGCMVIGRFTLRATDSSYAAAALVDGSGSARGRQWLFWNGKKIAKALGGRAYDRLREIAFRQHQSKVSDSSRS